VYHLLCRFLILFVTTNAAKHYTNTAIVVKQWEAIGVLKVYVTHWTVETNGRPALK